MIYLVLLTLMTGGGYVEEVSEFKGEVAQCDKIAKDHSKYSYCFQTTRRPTQSVPDASLPTQ